MFVHVCIRMLQWLNSPDTGYPHNVTSTSILIYVVIKSRIPLIGGGGGGVNALMDACACMGQSFQAFLSHFSLVLLYNNADIQRERKAIIR